MNDLPSAKVKLYSELLKIPHGYFDDDAHSNELELMFLLSKDKDVQKILNSGFNKKESKW